MRKILVALLLGLGLLLAACGGPAGDGSGTPPDGDSGTSFNVAGVWEGTWTSTQEQGAGSFCIELSQSGNQISGPFYRNGVYFGDASGTLDGNQITFGAASQGTYQITFTGTVTGDSANGTYTLKVNESTADTGNWSGSKTSESACRGEEDQPSSASAEDVVSLSSGVFDTLAAINTALERTGAPFSFPNPSPFGAGSTFPGPLQNVHPQDTVTWSCTAVDASGNTSDPDGDGVPVDATYSARCTYAYGGGDGSASWTWEMRDLGVRDPNSNDPYAGYQIGGEIVWTYATGSETVTATLTITRADVLKTGAGHYDLVHKSTLVVSGGDGSGQAQYDFTGHWAADPGQPKGLPFSVDGTFDGDGTVMVSTSDGTATLTFAGTNLHLSISCGGYDSGSVTVEVSTPEGTITCTGIITGCGRSTSSCSFPG